MILENYFKLCGLSVRIQLFVFYENLSLLMSIFYITFVRHFWNWGEAMIAWSASVDIRV